MAKIGRNDPCPCGSAKKYKKCCESRDLAAAADRARAATKGDVTVRSAMASAVSKWIAVEDDLDRVSNSVIDLINEGKLDEAEQVGLRLLHDYPEAHDGFERLGMVYEARGDRPRAVQMYQQALDFTLDKDGYDEEARDWYRDKIASLQSVTPAS